jgi:hypothetical protein
MKHENINRKTFITHDSLTCYRCKKISHTLQNCIENIDKFKPLNISQIEILEVNEKQNMTNTPN